MYVPPFNAVTDETEIRAMVATSATGWLVTVGEGGVPEGTLLPLIWEADRILAHMARANPQWRHIARDAPALVICSGPGAYISPSWYAAKAEHGRVVPTWNYSAVHLTGTVRVYDDPDWVRAAVTDLTNRHETGRPHRWQVTDAPEDYVATQLEAIVGIEMAVTGVQAKAKLSQNRSGADIDGVIAGLGGEASPGALAIAAAMSRLGSPARPPS